MESDTFHEIIAGATQNALATKCEVARRTVFGSGICGNSKHFATQKVNIDRHKTERTRM